MLDAPPGLRVRANQRQIEQVVSQPLDNALVHTEPDGHISVRIRRSKEGATVTVENDGVGLSSGDVTRVFRPFVRAATARGKEDDSSGVGLFVSAEIVAQHGGVIWADSDGIGKASSFHFTLKSTQDGAGPDAAGGITRRGFCCKDGW